jgi:hypothetical protein
VPPEGIEPSRSYDHQILSLAWLPFHQGGKKLVVREEGVEPPTFKVITLDALPLSYSRIDAAGWI